MKKNYKLIKKFITVSIAGGIALKILIPSEIKAKDITYNKDEQISVTIYAEELRNLQEKEDITFHNKDLFMIVKDKVGGNLTSDNIKKINTLEIDQSITQSDLSDLKYLTGLKFLIIKNNDVDCSQLKYNQELVGLKIENCTLTNTEELPNSITNLRITNTEVKDYSLVLPYNLQELTLKKTPINNIEAKNNSSIRKLTINGETYISASCLVPFTNLNYIKLIKCSNLKDPENLNLIPNLHILGLDEYSSIWLDSDTLDNLPVFPLTKASIDKKIAELDKIAESLKDNTLSEEEQITKILEYIINKYKYSEIVKEETLLSNVVSFIDNKAPITTSLCNDDIICINFATMFQAIANRLNIDSIVLVNDIHAWNAYNIDGEYCILDATSLNSYCEKKGITNIPVSLLESHIENPPSVTKDSVYPIDYQEPEYSIGYIKKDQTKENGITELNKFIESVIYNKNTFNIYTEPLDYILRFTIILEVIYIFKIISLSKKEKKEKSLKKNNKNNN